MVVFSKTHGKVHLLAKGVRKTTSRKRGGIEVFSWIGFQVAKTRSLDLVTEVEVIDSFEAVRRDLKKVSLAYFFCEVVGRVTHEEEKNEAVFDLLIEHLKKLKHERKLRQLRMDFVTRLLEETGFWPRGKPLANPDGVLAEVTEREINSVRVGKRLLTSEPEVAEVKRGN